MNDNFKDLAQQVRQLKAGKPVGVLTYHGGNSARDERGVIFRVQSYDQLEADQVRRRIFKQRMEGRKAGFTFNAMDGMKYVGQTLSTAQCGYLLILASYLNYDGVLVRSERDYTPLKQSDMIEILHLKQTQSSTVSNFVNAALNYGIMSRDEKGAYSIAPHVHFKGKNREGVAVVRAYIAQLRLLADTNKPDHIGFIYKLLPYMHKTTNVLCANPDELEPALIQKLTRQDLAAITGVHVDSISRVIRSMKIAERPVFAKITTATDGTFYMLNPEIFRRADSADYDPTARAIFGLSA